MKKKAAAAALLAAGVLGMTVFAAASSWPGPFARVIGEEKAEEIALEAAGFRRQDAVMGVTDLEYDQGRYIYDVEFTAGGMEHDYDILAADGTIVSASASAVRLPEAESPLREEAVPEEAPLEEEVPAGEADPGDPEAGGLIGVGQARALALADAGFEEGQVIMETARFERGDRNEPDAYEIEFLAGDREYEYTIDARTGEILERETETDDD